MPRRWRRSEGTAAWCGAKAQRRRSDTADQAAAQQAPAAPAAADRMAEVQKLAELHTAGVLTDEEFAAAKAKVLGI